MDSWGEPPTPEVRLEARGCRDEENSAHTSDGRVAGPDDGRFRGNNFAEACGPGGDVAGEPVIATVSYYINE